MGTNAKFEAKANESGNYVLPLLPVGSYEVTAISPGFRTVVRSGIVLQVGDRARVDFALQVGAAEQKVDVLAKRLWSRPIQAVWVRWSRTAASVNCR